jgi:tRNA/rRNA methyltransferase
MLTNCKIVLIRPHYPGNLGSIARVMHNFGLKELTLVSPLADRNDSEAQRMSTQGFFILQNAKIVKDFGDAIAGCQLAFATSALTEGIIRDRFFGTPEELIPSLVEMLPMGPCALVFGPEPSGLSNAEITRCHGMIHIPTDPEYSALNLAQSVAICLYELRKHWLNLNRPKKGLAEPMPTLDVQERMFEKLQQGLEEIHFLYGPKATALMHAVRHLISRARPREKEVKVLFGLARQLRYVAARWRQSTSPEPPIDPTELAEEAKLEE